MVYSPEKSPMPSSEKPGETPRIEVVPSIGEKKKTPEEIEEAKEIREKIERKRALKEIEKEKWKEIREKQKKGELLSKEEAAMIRERELAKRVKKEKRVEEEILEKPIEVKQEERPEEELEKELEERRKAYAEAYKQSREVLAKGKKEKELKELLEAYEPAIKPVREKHILTGDSEKLKQGDKEAEERRKNFIEELKTRGIKEERASAIYEAELKKAEYEAVKVEAGKKMAEAGVEKAEIFKKLILNEHDLLNQAKVETWPPKEKNCFRKAMAWWLKKPTKTRLLYSTLALTGGLAAAGAIGGIGMLAGASMATIAKFGGLRFIRALAGATVGQFVAGGIERTYGRKLARTKGEEEKILMAEFTIDNFSEIEKRRQQLQEKWYKKERNKTLVKAVAATIAGGGVAFGLGPMIEGALGIRIMPEAPPKAPPAEAPPKPGVVVPEEIKPKVPVEAPPEIKPEYLTIGKRGPEGAIIDSFRENPKIAVEKFGCPENLVKDGSIQDLDKFNEWAGRKAHLLWLEDAKENLFDPSGKIKPEMAEKLKKLGYSPDLEGYAQMMHRISKGSVELDLKTGKINVVVEEYLKARAAPEEVVPEKPLSPEEIALAEERGKPIVEMPEAKAKSTEEIFAEVSPKIGRAIITEKLHETLGMWSGTYDKFSDRTLEEFLKFDNSAYYRNINPPWEDYDYHEFSSLQRKLEAVYEKLDPTEKSSAAKLSVENFIKKYYLKIFP